MALSTAAFGRISPRTCAPVLSLQSVHSRRSDTCRLPSIPPPARQFAA
jgi:hypothetical protein